MNVKIFINLLKTNSLLIGRPWLQIPTLPTTRSTQHAAKHHDPTLNLWHIRRWPPIESTRSTHFYFSIEQEPIKDVGELKPHSLASQVSTSHKHCNHHYFFLRSNDYTTKK